MRPERYALVPILICAGFLAACTPAEEPMPKNDLVSGGEPQTPAACEKTARALAEQWIGKPFEALKPQLDPERLSGVERLRTYPKGSALTMDYMPARLNVEYDENGKVTRIHCG